MPWKRRIDSLPELSNKTIIEERWNKRCGCGIGGSSEETKMLDHTNVNGFLRVLVRGCWLLWWLYCRTGRAVHQWQDHTKISTQGHVCTKLGVDVSCRTKNQTISTCPHSKYQSCWLLTVVLFVWHVPCGHHSFLFRDDVNRFFFFHLLKRQVTAALEGNAVLHLTKAS